MPATLQTICRREFQKGQLQSAQMNCKTLLGLKDLQIWVLVAGRVGGWGVWGYPAASRAATPTCWATYSDQMSTNKPGLMLGSADQRQLRSRVAGGGGGSKPRPGQMGK